ncbi:MAG TPA: glycosyltransferase family 2 protein [Lacibacter sp.]|nr:glycosyltransferase family 2 protein [Lacibacter sp.]HMO88426.1 glycosyltransferase family 2 protein [Lacibacter sp.]HMP85888.1 glycosyltransferase family 2 protein [Lacibacter sp.]
MSSFSIVIVVKNAAATLPRLLRSLDGLSNDVVVVDTGSTDATRELALMFTDQVHTAPWEGYGRTKQKAALLARNDWVLSLDADEEVTEELRSSLRNWKPGAPNQVYQLHWLNFVGGRPIRYGLWSNDWKNRLFHRKTVNWNDAEAHEDLVAAVPLVQSKLSGRLHHYSFNNLFNLTEKHIHYAWLMGNHMQKKGKRPRMLKMVLSPVWIFLKGYLFRLGFLDGLAGFHIARTTAYYAYLKNLVLWEQYQAAESAGTQGS